MEKINVAELLRDCPSGMELDCAINDNVKFIKICSSSTYPIILRTKNGHEITLTKYGQVHNMDDSKCVIFPKGKTTWDGFVPPCKFKDGDILTTRMGSIFIFSHLELERFSNRNMCKAYVGIRDTMPISLFLAEDSSFGPYENMCRLATEKEKEKLFQSIKDNGYRWNTKTKTLEELIEPEFKDGDVITCTNSACSFVAIFKEINTDTTFKHYVSLTLDDVQQFCAKVTWADFKNPRLATGEEKQKLFDAIKAHGYKWNTEIKTLEKFLIFKVGDRIKWIKTGKICEIIKILSNCYIANYLGSDITILFDRQDDWELVPDKFDITTLKPFESRVLVRTKHFHDTWVAGFFSHKDSDGFAPFWTTADKNYQQCIPYEGNEHLLGTTNDCDKFYRTWEGE